MDTPMQIDTVRKVEEKSDSVRPDGHERVVLEPLAAAQVEAFQLRHDGRHVVEVALLHRNLLHDAVDHRQVAHRSAQGPDVPFASILEHTMQTSSS